MGNARVRALPPFLSRVGITSITARFQFMAREERKGFFSFPFLPPFFQGSHILCLLLLLLHLHLHLLNTFPSIPKQPFLRRGKK